MILVRRGRALVAERVRLIADGFEPPDLTDLSVQGRPAGPPVTLAWPEADLEGEIRVPGVKDRGGAAIGAAAPLGRV